MAHKIAITDGYDFVTPPECGGQTVERSYAWAEGPGEGYIIERVHDRSDGEVYYEIFRATADRFEPWNTTPSLGKKVRGSEAYVAADRP